MGLARTKWLARISARVAVAAATLSVLTVGASAGPSTNPGVPLSQSPVRSVEPVVLTGQQFPTWSAGPEVTAREPMSPLNTTADGKPYPVSQGSEPKQFQSDCYDSTPGGPDYGSAKDPNYTDNGDHNCYQSSRSPVRTDPLASGVDPRRILGYRWNPKAKRFTQIPFQVDQVFTRYVTNNASNFAFYSGVDQDTDYAYDREGFRFLANRPPAPGTAPTADVCQAIPFDGRKTNPTSFYDGQSTTPSPNGFHMVDKDELSFMAKDAGVQAPATAMMPKGIIDSYTVTVRDPENGTTGYVYVALAGSKGPEPAYTVANSPYVHYRRDPDANLFQLSKSGNGGYGQSPHGWYCNPDGTLAVNASGTPLVDERRPKDTAWAWTPRYAFRYDGRWLMTELHVSPNDNGYIDGSGVLHNYGPNIVDRWKARAFQQRPGGQTPCCGFEEEATNWGGSSQLMGERAGPVRVIRTTWGADSSTNNIRREIFYEDEVRYQGNLRVHPIPPLDGIYVQRDMAAGMITKYYNPYQSQGVSIDGLNDEVFGNIHAAANSNGFCYSSQDQLGQMTETYNPDTTPVTVPLPGGNGDPCNSGDVHGDFDLTDPTLQGPPGLLPWEELAGDHGTVVERWTAQSNGAPVGTAASAVTAFPYYRDDSCFDDGTGTDPGPKIDLRSGNEPKFWWYDPTTGIPVSNDTPPANAIPIPRRCWNHDVNGNPLPPGHQDAPPNPSFSPQGDVRYFQGDIGTHGLHLIFTGDTDNAQLTVPVDELDSEQVQVILPGLQPNVGEAYGRSFEEPLVATAVPNGVQLENLNPSARPSAHSRFRLL